MRKTVVINAVGLTPSLIGPATPRLRAFAERGALATVGHVLPAVTCSVQATYLTGRWPSDHGIVGNGWYFRDECEIKFWRQSNQLVQQPSIWEMARALDPTFTCANLFWWYNMYSSVDYAVTPRPMYPADGRKLPDIYSKPADLRPWLQAKLGQFPLFEFWGPNSSIRSSAWIAESAKLIDQRHDPTLTLIYLPHLDYCLQRAGPDLAQIEGDLRALDVVCGDLFDYYAARGAQVIVLSEYGVAPVGRPIHLNRVLREQGLIAVRDELGRELLDAGASAAFAVADHQLAHVYVADPARLSQVRAVLEAIEGVAQVLEHAGKQAHRLDHPRAGEFVVLAAPDAWFTYYYWLDDRRAPDYARTVDIHRKPGYDPVELFIDPAIRFPPVKVGWKLLRKQLGFRYLMDVIPLDATLVRGSHGIAPSAPANGALVMTSAPELLGATSVEATDVCGLILRHLNNEDGHIPEPAWRAGADLLLTAA
ncbi:MAG TPA: alkaline phosphatase family protein [Roseiflexaceae bacterium]|nr:alkaline phosphatase family protein [Roseiflexaceae bacterium]